MPRFADAEAKLYGEFGLLRANWRQYVNLESIGRMLIAWLQGHRAGLLARKSFRHKLVSDRPDEVGMAEVG